jgi:MobA-like NTP transferase domain
VTSPTLVLLAAGLATRFGSLKQIAPVGPEGEAILDYSIGDARASGLDDIVIVVRSSIRAEVAAHVCRRHDGIRFVNQDDLGPERDRPWGTVHAMLAAGVDGAFVVANADDYYGAESMRLAADAAARDRSALVAFPLSATLSDRGPVSRALCDVAAGGKLRSCVEHVGLSRGADGAIRSEHGAVPHDRAPVSMNLWAFGASVIDEFQRVWNEWIVGHRHHATAELRTPDVVDQLIAGGRLEVDVITSPDRWLGVTYADDLVGVRAAFANRLRA